MAQEFFDFGFKAQMRDDNFIVSESNKRALLLVDEWPQWPGHAVLIYGPHGSGKTMITKIWQKKSYAKILKANELYTMVSNVSEYKGGCYIIDGLENVHDEAALFHFFNNVKEDNGYLLITANSHPSNLKIRLADLRSRINAVLCIGVSNPDDELLKTLFFKHFVERQLKVDMNVIGYLVSRVERSFDSVSKIVEEIDRSAMQEKRNITIPFVKSCLEKMGYISEEIAEPIICS